MHLNVFASDKFQRVQISNDISSLEFDKVLF